MMPVIIHRGCDLPLHYEAVEYYDGLGLTLVCPFHGAVPVFTALIGWWIGTEPIAPIPLPRGEQGVIALANRETQRHLQEQELAPRVSGEP